MMQGPVARRGLAPDAKDSRKDSTARLMETATKMMKNGATPDVVAFIDSTIQEINGDDGVLAAIVEQHQLNQESINEDLMRFDAAVAAMEECAVSVAEAHTERTSVGQVHQECRSLEALDCARSRKCEEELETLWSIVKYEEEEMKRLHWAIHGEWCVGTEPPQPDLDSPFEWTIADHSEGPETSASNQAYPAVDYTPDQKEFRRFSVEFFGLYIAQRPKVVEAWENYNIKLAECAEKEETLDNKVIECDGLQDTLHDQACTHASGNRQCASNFGHEYHMTEVAYNLRVTDIQRLEYDRKREWETLHIVTCLMETVYTHVVHAIDSGEPCPTIESHPEQTEAEIQNCHVVEERMTDHLTIDYGNPPPAPALPPVVEPPCSAQYIWDEHGSFSYEIQTSHSQTISDEGLENYFTALSAYGWAGCAAPKACIPCESTDLIVDPSYVENEVCKAHHRHLTAGQMDRDTFKCLSGDECIRASGRCNGEFNCDDESDEDGCDTEWGVPAVMGSQECQDPFVSDVQFRCADNSCTHVAGRCNGVVNCADGSDEQDCAATTTGLTLEAMTGLTASIETPAVNSAVFYDRTYTFESLGSFTGHSFIKMSNEDKHIPGTHVQIKLRLPQPLTVYVSTTGELPWLTLEGWTLTHLDGPTYHGVRPTRHTDWLGEISSNTYGPGQVWQKTFPAGTVEMRGNNGGDGSYLLFVANPANAPASPAVPIAVTTNFAQSGGGNTCPGTDVSEADCLGVVQGLLASGQNQGRATLVAGSWGWVPPGCSVQSHFTHGQNGDFAAHYNRGAGNNDGGYTKVCNAPCQHLHNQDVVAGTFAHYGLDYANSPSDEACSATCTADPECTAWVRKPSDGHCWISRQAVVTFEADTDRTTGLRCN